MISHNDFFQSNNTSIKDKQMRLQPSRENLLPHMFSLHKKSNWDLLSFFSRMALWQGNPILLNCWALLIRFTTKTWNIHFHYEAVEQKCFLILGKTLLAILCFVLFGYFCFFIVFILVWFLLSCENKKNQSFSLLFSNIKKPTYPQFDKAFFSHFDGFYSPPAQHG